MAKRLSNSHIYYMEAGKCSLLDGCGLPRLRTGFGGSGETEEPSVGVWLFLSFLLNMFKVPDAHCGVTNLKRDT